MDEQTKARVWLRAQGRCEYCHLQQEYSALPHQIDHIIPIKHHGDEAIWNLAISCSACNNHKGTNISGLEKKSSRLIRLFHPRKNRWNTHFRWNKPILAGKTPIGRVTIDVLCINLPYRIALRQELIAHGFFLE